MRPISELYKILLRYFEENVNTNFFLYQGICAYIQECDLFTHKERIFLKRNFKANRPSHVLHTEYMDKDRHWTSFWWDLDKKGNKQRVEFLKHIIKYHENNHPIIPASTHIL